MVSLNALPIIMLAIGGIALVNVLPNTPSFALDINCSTVIKCFGTTGNDVMRGGIGDNQMHGFAGNDDMFGGIGNDWMVGYEGDDRIVGQDGNDKIRGEQGNDRLFGVNGDDEIWAEEGNDFIRGMLGADQLIGGPGADIINGEDGNDIIWHGPAFSNAQNSVSDGSRDIIDCGEGFDQVIYNTRDDDSVINCEQKFNEGPIGNENCDRPGMPGCPE